MLLRCSVILYIEGDTECSPADGKRTSHAARWRGVKGRAPPTTPPPWQPAAQLLVPGARDHRGRQGAAVLEAFQTC